MDYGGSSYQCPSSSGCGEEAGDDVAEDDFVGGAEVVQEERADAFVVCPAGGT
jgi:hypothetical protein